VKFCFVRHGQTDWNIEGRYQGQSDVPLNKNGRFQAHQVAKQLIKHRLCAIFSSDLVRAVETAEIIGAVLHLPVKTDGRLREINQGEWEGQLVDKIKDYYSKLWQQRSSDPANVRPPGGETVSELGNRVCEVLDEIAKGESDGPVLIVSHGLALATAICRNQHIEFGHAYEWIPPNAEPIWVEWNSSNRS
jgi:broad specificity phosphatase PhoE